MAVGFFRFRPNIVLSGAGAFAEDLWEEITIGPSDRVDSESSPRFMLVSKCARCLVGPWLFQTCVLLL